jgi:glycosyltransferase involved in cell wall biosynthesis
MYPGRGIELIFNLAVALPQRRFHIIGPLDSFAAVDATTPANVVFYDNVTPSQAHRLCRLFDVLLMPYQHRVHLANRLNTATWMSPMKMFEYMLAERPTVASDLPVLREVLRDGETALLVPPADSAAWTAAIQRLDDPALRHALARAAWEEATDRYTWPTRARDILATLG